MTQNACDKCLKKLTVRNFVTVSTIITFLFLVVYAVVYNPIVLDNPLVTFVLGTFAPVTMMVYTFYYRKNKSSVELDEKPILGDICPCCGQKIQ